jgi:hypothetical protein
VLEFSVENFPNNSPSLAPLEGFGIDHEHMGRSFDLVFPTQTAIREVSGLKIANLARPLFASSTRDRLLIAASDRARASGSLDGYRPAAPVAPVIGIIVIPTITLTVAGLTNVN